MKRLVAVLLAICLGLAFISTVSAQQPTLTLLIHPTLYLAAGGDEGIVKEFQEQHNCIVNVVTATDAMSKAMLDFIAQAGAYDVINVNGPEFTRENSQHFMELDGLISESPDYEFSDFLPGPVSIGQFDGKQVGIPYRMTQLLIYYRTDLFAEAAKTVPEQWDQVYETAKALTKDVDGDGKVDIYGFAHAGKGEELAHAWLSAFYGMGGRFIAEDGKSAGFNSEAGIKCAQLFADMYQNGILPEDIFAWGRDDFIAAMAQGRIAFAPFIGAYYGRFFDDKITPEQVGFAPLPNGGANRSNGWFLSISKHSKQPELAWELLKALTSKENGLRAALEWANGPTRTSIYESEEYKALWPQANELMIAANNIVRDPSTSNSSLMFTAIAEELTYVMQGSKTAEQGMSDLNVRIDDLFGF